VKKFLKSAMIVVSMMPFALATNSLADSQTFSKPKQGGNRLDWCLNWSEGCGEAAATAWCKTKGFDKATDFKMAADIGVSQPTRLLATGAVCDQGFCDGFKFITCESAGSKTFINPKQGGNRLDWCLDWATGCGKPAADAWCQSKGYGGGSSDFSMAANIGASTPTRLIRTGALCDQGFCDGFAKITCEQ